MVWVCSHEVRLTTAACCKQARTMTKFNVLVLILQRHCYILRVHIDNVLF